MIIIIKSILYKIEDSEYLISMVSLDFEGEVLPLSKLNEMSREQGLLHFLSRDRL